MLFNLEPIFCIQATEARDCWIAQADYQGQTRYTTGRILDCKPFINTYYQIGNRLELNCFTFAWFFKFAQFS